MVSNIVFVRSFGEFTAGTSLAGTNRDAPQLICFMMSVGCEEDDSDDAYQRGHEILSDSPDGDAKDARKLGTKIQAVATTCCVEAPLPVATAVLTM